MPYRLPDRCPVCGAPVVRDEDGAALRCTGAECPAQLSRNLAHFVSREAMNIDGLGSAIIDLLIEEKMVSNPADLYALDYAAFAKLPGQGKSPPRTSKPPSRPASRTIWPDCCARLASGRSAARRPRCSRRRSGVSMLCSTHRWRI